MNPALPEKPTFLWTEKRSPWPLTLLGMVLLGDTTTGFDRDVAVSANGIMLHNGRGRFLWWNEIDEIVVADDPDLATVRLNDGTSIVLDQWHLPRYGRRHRRKKAARVEVLQAALAAGKEGPAGSQPVREESS